MTRVTTRPNRFLAGTATAAALALVATSLSATARAQTTPAPSAVTTVADSVPGLSDLDTRGSTVPTATQLAAVKALGVQDARFNQFGTPTSLLPASGSLGRAASADPVVAAKRWLVQHAAAFGLSSGQMSGLQLVNDQKFAQSGARAVLFRQRFGTLPAALDSMVTVGVAAGRIAYVSSSLARTSATPPAAVLTPLQGWLKAAANVGQAVPATKVAAITVKATGDWTELTVPGFAQTQQVRLRSLALADGRVRPVYEANVVNVAGGSASAYTLMVDAVSGAVLHRQNQVDNSSDAFQFQGEITATACGPQHKFQLTDDKTRTIMATAAVANSADDIVLKLFDPNGALLTSGDTATSPESITYTAASLPAGLYSIQVCPFKNPTVPFTPPGNYAAMVSTSDQSGSVPAAAGNPRWRLFPANPTLDWSAGTTPHNSVVACWTRTTGCTYPLGSLSNLAAAGPWDINVKTGQPTLTTVGNNATTHEAWASPLTPGGTEQAPVSPTREYTTPFTDAWNNSKCDPTQLHPGGNDINAVVGNLFASHNRMHDFAYYLGFTESNYNLQTDNLGRGGKDGDPETGNAQAGALTGGQPSYLGRDNANQIALQDGVPGITNQYLFQPIAGAFYSPCVDGSVDMSVVGHEYTHAISNRMVGGPDEGLTSEQGGAMGESWSDLVAMEYQFENGFSTGTSPYVIGAYATGNRTVGIRDFALDKNPLNYSDYGFDTPGVEVHADGEIWNGTQFSVRQALIRKWNKKYPAGNRSLQLACAQATATSSPRPAGQCPGNRRWLQLLFDSFLLQQGATSMLDARDAMLAADTMRFGGVDKRVMWKAFARRGMGAGARSTADGGDPTPKFAVPGGRRTNTHVRFRTNRPGKVYVGSFEARVTPAADTLPATKKTVATANFTPGRYRMLFVAKGGGFKRFTMVVKKQARQVVSVRAPKNWASAALGAKVIGTSAGSLNTKFLIDETERTNWAGVNSDGTNVDARHPFVSVQLAGAKKVLVRRVQVSAYLNPAPAGATDVPLLHGAQPDPDSGSRFTALRRFALDACVRNCASAKAVWKRFYVSAANAFPAVAPRPVAPNLNLRSFKVKGTYARAVRLVVLENQCTGYPGYAGERDNDPTNDTDCKTASDRGTIVHVAELQVF